MRKHAKYYIKQMVMAINLLLCTFVFIQFFSFGQLAIPYLLLITLFYSLMLVLYHLLFVLRAKESTETAEIQELLQNQFLYQILDFINAKLSKFLFCIFIFTVFIKQISG